MEKKNRYAAILVPTILLLIVVLFPLISWYYLRSGLEWRKEAQGQMSGTTPFPSMSYTSPEGLKFTPASLEEHVTLISFLPCMPDTAYTSVLHKIYDQFKETNKANFVLLDSCSQVYASMDMPDRKNWYVLPCEDIQVPCDELVRLWGAGHTFALVDRKGIVRSFYSIRTKEERRLLVEHMALLIPRERQEKVELKRGETQ